MKPGKENVGANIKELMASGKRPQKQAVAIALKEAGLSNKYAAGESASGHAAEMEAAARRAEAAGDRHSAEIFRRGCGG